MKKILSLMIVSAFLCGCGGNEFVHSKEPRSHVYYGQPVADLYENFGHPTRGIKYSEQERALVYDSQEVEKEWAYRYFKFCTMTFYLKEDRVVDWTAVGDKCVVNGLAGRTQPDFYPNGQVPADAFGSGSMNVPSDAFGESYTQSTPAMRTSTVAQEEFGLFDAPSTPTQNARTYTSQNGVMPAGFTNNSSRYTHQVPSDEFGGYNPMNTDSVRQKTVYGSVPNDAFSNNSFQNAPRGDRTSTVVQEEFGLFDRPTKMPSDSSYSQQRVMGTSSVNNPGRFISQVPADAF